MDEAKFLDPYSTVRVTGLRLPHWQQENATYFVTFRMADSIPSSMLGELRVERQAWLKAHPQPWTPEIELEYHQRFSGRVEEWLDAGHGSCSLRNPECAEVVQKAFRFFDGNRYDLYAAVVMPNHVHLLFSPLADFTLEQVIHSWKLFTARQLNALLRREGQFWQRDYFDRMIRDNRHFERVVRYIRGNPERAKLREGEYLLYESELAQGVQ